MMKKPAPWIVLLLAIIAGAAWYFLIPRAPEEHPSVVALPEQPEAPAEPKATYPVEAIEVPGESAVEPLPLLEESDRAVLDVLAEWLGAAPVENLFVKEQLISRIVTTIDALDSRQLAPQVLPLRPPAGKFLVLGGAVTTVHSDNAARYEPYVRIASLLDTRRTVEWYVRHYPLFQEAYEELGRPGHFNDRLVGIIDHLAATPQPGEQPALIKPEAVWLFEDPDLEALSAGQKLLLRIGPENRVAITTKLKEIRAGVAGL